MKTLFTILVISLVLFSACDSNCIEGGGSLHEYELSVETFNKLSVSGPIDVNITQGETQSVSVYAEPEIFGVMETKVKNNELIIGFENRTCISTTEGISLNITIADLRRIEISGTSTIRTIGDLNVDRLTIDISGTCETYLTGSASTQSIDVSGVLDSYNFDFQTEQMDIDISGAGNMEVSCSENLDVKVSGAASIKYKGAPRITQNVSGSIDLIDSN